MPFLSHAGVSLRYDRTGSGPAVLLVHGWTCNRTFWERQVTALRDRHTVITVDLRGHGESTPPRTGYSVATLAADLEHLVKALGVPRIALVGWSLGGTVVLDLARRLGERASALALVCTIPGGATDPKNPNRLPAAQIAETRSAIRADIRAFFRTYGAAIFHDGDANPLVGWAVSQMQKTPPHTVEPCLDAVLAFDARKWLRELAVPTAVLHGRHDTLFPLVQGEALQQAIPGATLTVFEHSAHAPHLEEPDAFNAALSNLLTH